MSFRVKLSTVDGSPLSVELIDDAREADDYFRQVQKDETLFDDMPFTVLLLSMEELCHGEWVMVSSKIMRP